MKSIMGLAGALILSGSSLVAQTPAVMPNALANTNGTAGIAAPGTPIIFNVPAVGAPAMPSTPAEGWQRGVEGYPAASTQPLVRTLIGSDLFFRIGPSLIIGGGTLQKQLNTTGFTVEGGGRSLFFNGEGSAAWAIELGLIYTYNNGGHTEPIRIYNETGFISALHRTAGQIAIGREWFPSGSADVTAHQDSFWRYGVDVGGRWGTGHIAFQSVPHVDPERARKHDVYGATFLAGNLNLEVPMGGTWSYVFGLRAEWAYTWSDLVPGHRGTLYDLNLLFSTGLRF